MAGVRGVGGGAEGRVHKPECEKICFTVNQAVLRTLSLTDVTLWFLKITKYYLQSTLHN